MDHIAALAPVALSAAEAIPCAGRSALHHRLQSEESYLTRSLSALQAELDSCMRAAWLACAQRDLSGECERSRCDVLFGEVERLERELCHVRTAIAGIVEDLQGHIGASAG